MHCIKMCFLMKFLMEKNKAKFKNQLCGTVEWLDIIKNMKKIILLR